MVLSAAWEYGRGVISAIRGDRRTFRGVGKSVGDAAVAVGDVVGVSVGIWVVGGS